MKENTYKSGDIRKATAVLLQTHPVRGRKTTPYIHLSIFYLLMSVFAFIFHNAFVSYNWLL